MRASALVMLESSKEKAALWAAEFLVVGFSCEVEAQSRDFAVALDDELAIFVTEVQCSRYDFCRTKKYVFLFFS